MSGVALCINATQDLPSSVSTGQLSGPLPAPIIPEVVAAGGAGRRGAGRVRSPDTLETTFTMSTIEEEIESVQQGH